MEGLESTTLSSASSYLRVVSIHVDHGTTDHLANVSAIARGSEEMSERWPHLQCLPEYGLRKHYNWFLHNLGNCCILLIVPRPTSHGLTQW